MILRTRQISNNINHQIRKELAMAYRLVRRCILLNRIPPDEERIDREPQFTWKAWMSGLVLLITLGIMCLFAGCAMSQEIPDQKAIKSIIGEAENQGFEGMLAVAHAIRNRGNLKGIYGFRSYRVSHHIYSRDIYEMATIAWDQSGIDYDLTHGATGWGNAEDVQKFGMCRWWGHCVITFRYRDHVFYKEQK